MGLHADDGPGLGPVLAPGGPDGQDELPVVVGVLLLPPVEAGGFHCVHERACAGPLVAYSQFGIHSFARWPLLLT